MKPVVEGWTEARYWTFIRSNLRKGWSKYPNNYKVLHASRRPYTGSDKRIKWEYRCKICKEWWVKRKIGKKKSTISVDHIVPCGKLSAEEHIGPFVVGLYCRTKNLQVLCHICHDIKTYSERWNMTWEQAEKRKEVILFLKQPATEQKKYLKGHGWEPGEMKTKDLREQCYLTMMRNKGKL